MHRASRSFFCLLLVLGTVILHAADYPQPARWTDADEGFRLRVRQLLREKGHEAAVLFVQKRIAKKPNPNVLATWAEMSIHPDAYGLPADRVDAGFALLREAASEGSALACRCLGYELLAGDRISADPELGRRLVGWAAAAGEPGTAAVRGLISLYGLDGKVDLAEAERQCFIANSLGDASALFHLGEIYEKRPFDRERYTAKALDLYLIAARNYAPARKHLLGLAAQENNDAAHKRSALLFLWISYSGDNTRHQETAEAIAYLQQHFPDDPDALVAIGRMYCSDRSQYLDIKNGRALLEKAASLGSDDARCELAWLQAIGTGFTRDPASAVATWNELAGRNHPGALSALAWFQVHGGLPGIPVNGLGGFLNARRAAELGNADAIVTLAQCYADGIGVTRDYALAARYFYAAPGYNHYQLFVAT